MGSLCVLWFILLNTLHHGFAQAPTLTLKNKQLQIFWGETVTFQCEIEGSDWYRWRIRGSDTRYTTQNEYSTSAYDGEYRCLGRKESPQGYTNSEWSDPFRLTVSPQPTAELSADRNVIPAGGAVTLNCKVNPPSSGWKFHWYRGDRPTEIQITQDACYSVTEGGVYSCRGARGDPPYYTHYSNQINFNKILSDRAVVTRDPNWPEMFRGEKITLRCDIQDGGVTEWRYEWKTTGSNTFPQQSETSAVSAVVNSGGEYKCKGTLKTDPCSSTEWSAPITLTVLEHKPKANLMADNKDIPEGGSVTLTCSVNPSYGWKYTFWYKQDKPASFKAVKGSGVTLNGQIQVSEEGIYLCRGERGNPVYFTESSDDMSINKKNMAVVTLHPNWSEIYSGEKMTLKCEIKGVDDSEWDYEWEVNSSSSWKPEKRKEFSLTSANRTHGGDYKCRGRKKSDRSYRVWSNPITLTVVNDKPKPVLDVSSSWLSPGDSVTLSCEVKNPSAGWRFYWYKTVPKLPGDSYNYELLSKSSNGTEQFSFIVHGQTHTAGYVCRAGRGDPVFYSEHSAPKFVWSADFHSSASLRVSPNRAQHFISDSVSLNCEGNSSQWRVMRFQRESTVRGCSTVWTKTETSCTIPTYSTSNDVFWCESESGEFSNAVNITKQSYDIFLESPVHPVNEGSSVSLSCRFRYESIVSNVFFYHNHKLIQNDTRKELNISAVSKSNEGFYKCQWSGKESAQSWMAVRAVSKPRSSSFPMMLMGFGLICGVIILVLLLLCSYRKFKDSCSHRPVQSVSPNQDLSSSHVVDQVDAQYSTLLHADACVYESLRGPEVYENVHSRRINQDLSTGQIVDQRDAQHDQYSTLLHSDAAVYETLKGSGK